MRRIVITIKDCANLLGLSYKQAQRIHQTIRDSFNKKEAQYLSISEFCNYTGIPETDVIANLK